MFLGYACGSTGKNMAYANVQAYHAPECFATQTVLALKVFRSCFRNWREKCCGGSLRLEKMVYPRDLTKAEWKGLAPYPPSPCRRIFRPGNPGMDASDAGKKTRGNSNISR
jgi:hypothetical protein